MNISPPRHSSKGATAWFYAMAFLVLCLDQGSKFWLRRALAVGETVPVLPGLVSVTHVHNTGAAFGMFPAGTTLFAVLSAVVCVGLVVWAQQPARDGVLLRLALALELGGALGNLIDRAVFGYVTDFIDLGTSIRVVREFPVFNLADTSLTIGAVCIILYLLKGTRRIALQH
jgi:signal peptidase II